MTISKTPRADLSRLVDPHARALIEGEQARTTVARDFIDQRTDMPAPPEPWSEPVEREDLIDWRGVLIGIVAVAVFCAIWIALP
jgi:hypothetical protein